MNRPAFDLPTPEMQALQRAVNKALTGIAKVNLFIRVEGHGETERRKYCVLIQDGTRRWTRESDHPLGEQDKDEIVQTATELVTAPRPVASRYQAFTI